MAPVVCSGVRRAVAVVLLLGGCVVPTPSLQVLRYGLARNIPKTLLPESFKARHAIRYPREFLLQYARWLPAFFFLSLLFCPPGLRQVAATELSGNCAVTEHGGAKVLAQHLPEPFSPTAPPHRLTAASL